MSELNSIPAAEANPLPELTVEQLPERLREAVGRAGWTSLMPVQAKALPYLLAGREMIVQARTGSGKTGAFLLPLLERLDVNKKACQALILVPTRELAKQVADDAETLCGNNGFRSAVVYGGVGYGPQREALRDGAQIVIGTPGRVLDLLLKRAFNLDELEVLLFDEADRMLSMGFYPDMKQLQRHLPRKRLQASMFSATFPASVLRTAREFIQEPHFLSLSEDQVHVSTVEHLFFEVPGMEKDRVLVRLIEVENPASAIIFCNTKSRVHYVTTVLQRFGYDADEISADLSQADRERVLGRVRKGNLRFLVATDVAGRGIDIPELSHVFQYEPPDDPEQYIHRAGRTGRAGASGVAITLASELETLEIGRIARRFNLQFQTRPLPTPEDVEAVVSQRLTTLLEARLRQRDTLIKERSRRFIRLARELAESEDESEIIAMLLDDLYQESLHAPIAQPTGEPAAQGQQRRMPPPKPAKAPRQPAAQVAPAVPTAEAAVPEPVPQATPEATPPQPPARRMPPPKPPRRPRPEPAAESAPAPAPEEVVPPVTDTPAEPPKRSRPPRKAPAPKTAGAAAAEAPPTSPSPSPSTASPTPSIGRWRKPL